MEREHYYEWDILFLKCSRCKEFKESILFNKNKSRAFWFDCYCKECNSVIAKQKYHKDVEESRKKRRAQQKKYRQKNREKVNKKQRESYSTEKAREYQRRFRERHYETYIEGARMARKKALTQWKKPNRMREKKKSEEFWFDMAAFHNKASVYIRKNWLRPNECMACGLQWQIDFHHPSYESKNNWSKWIFLCKWCHNRVHTWELQCPESVDLIQLNAHMPKILTDKDLENVYT